jgi:hypothetical protein
VALGSNARARRGGAGTQLVDAALFGERVNQPVCSGPVAGVGSGAQPDGFEDVLCATFEPIRYGLVNRTLATRPAPSPGARGEGVTVAGRPEGRGADSAVSGR